MLTNDVNASRCATEESWFNSVELLKSVCQISKPWNVLPLYISIGVVIRLRELSKQWYKGIIVRGMICLFMA